MQLFLCKKNPLSGSSKLVTGGFLPLYASRREYRFLCHGASARPQPPSAFLFSKRTLLTCSTMGISTSILLTASCQSRLGGIDALHHHLALRPWPPAWYVPGPSDSLLSGSGCGRLAQVTMRSPMPVSPLESLRTFRPWRFQVRADLCDTAGNQSCFGIVAVAQSVSDTCCQGNDIFQGTAQLQCPACPGWCKHGIPGS